MKWNFLARHMITNKVTTIHTCNACNKTLRKIQCLKKHIKAESVHHSQSQEMPSIAMVRAASATARGIFSLGAPRRIGLWWPWPGEEKHLQLAQLQQDGGHPAGEVQAVLPPIHQSPAAGEAVHLSYVSFSNTNPLSVVWFGWQQPQQPRLLRKFMISWFNRSLVSQCS